MAVFTASISATAADPMATDFTYDDCLGSMMPYPQKEIVSVPDSLTPVFINYIGRHGARYPASASHCRTMREALLKADSLRTITSLGKELLQITNEVIEQCDGLWGSLDLLGEEEMRSIANNIYEKCPEVFSDGNDVEAMSSWSPRCMMSMYCFTHQLDRINHTLNFKTTTSQKNSPLLRFFDSDEDYIEYKESTGPKEAYSTFFDRNCPVTAIGKVLGKDYEYQGLDNMLDLAMTEYYVLASLPAMQYEIDLHKYFTKDEINSLWSCFNLRHYIYYSANTISSAPAQMAAPLLSEIINTTDAYIEGNNSPAAILRFGHAETLMPLLSLMRLQEGYYLTNYFDTVAKHWQDFTLVPMGANLQLLLFKDKKNGSYYVRFDLNDTPVTLIPNNSNIYLPWTEARAYLEHCLPMHLSL